MRATTLAKAARFWVAAIVLAAALAVSGGAFAQTRGGGPAAAAPAPAPAPAGSHGYATGAGADSSSCDGGPTLPALPTFQDSGDSVKSLSRATEAYIRGCGCATQDCIANALDKYAEALAQVAPHLPPQLQEAPSVVAQAAKRVRAARNAGEAQRALRDAIAIIHKDIELVKAEEPDKPRLTRGGDFVVETLSVASLALEKGGGL